MTNNGKDQEVQEVSERISYPGGLLDGLIGFEQGTLDEDEVIDLFQHLVDTGLAWQLQGFYGRTASDLLDAGLVTQPGYGEREDCPADCPCRVVSDL